MCVCVCMCVRVCVLCVCVCVCVCVCSMCVRMCVHGMPMYGSNHVMHTKSSIVHKSVMLVTPCGRKRGFQQNG